MGLEWLNQVREDSTALDRAFLFKNLDEAVESLAQRAVEELDHDTGEPGSEDTETVVSKPSSGRSGGNGESSERTPAS